jgi:hypothetical protein
MDDVIKSELHHHHGDNTLTHVATQPTEKIILERNAELRKNAGAFHDLGEQSGESFGRLMASIPIIMYDKALRDGYDLNSKDKAVADLEMMRYLGSTEGRMCVVQAPTQKYHQGGIL